MAPFSKGVNPVVGRIQRIKRMSGKIYKVVKPVFTEVWAFIKEHPEVVGLTLAGVGAGIGAGVGASVGGWHLITQAANIHKEAIVQAANTQAGTIGQSTSTYQQLSLETQQQEILLNYLNQVEALTADKVLADQDKNRLEANSLTTLRNLDGEHKGYLIRFLNEQGLLKANQQELSLSGANLRGIILKDAWLPDINLEGTYMLNGELQNVSLKRANLKQTDLTGADLTGADLTGADLTGAILCHTTMPDGSTANQGCP